MSPSAPACASLRGFSNPGRGAVVGSRGAPFRLHPLCLQELHFSVRQNMVNICALLLRCCSCLFSAVYSLYYSGSAPPAVQGRGSNRRARRIRILPSSPARYQSDHNRAHSLGRRPAAHFTAVANNPRISKSRSRTNGRLLTPCSLRPAHSCSAPGSLPPSGGSGGRERWPL